MPAVAAAAVFGRAAYRRSRGTGCGATAGTAGTAGTGGCGGGSGCGGAAAGARARAAVRWPVMTVVRSLVLFALAAVVEIGGAWLV